MKPEELQKGKLYVSSKFNYVIMYIGVVYQNYYDKSKPITLYEFLCGKKITRFYEQACEHLKPLG